MARISFSADMYIWTNVQSGIIVSHAGTTTSDRLLPGFPNSFNLLEGDPKNILISRYHWSEGDFTYLTKQSFIKQSDGWYEQ